MKAGITIVLLLTLAFQALYPAGFMVWFYANRAAIAERYCVNKARPMLHCEGKCFLAKKIRQAEEEQSRETTSTRNVWVEVSPCIILETQAMILPDFLKSPVRVPHLPKPYQFRHSPAIFHPPGITVA